MPRFENDKLRQRYALVIEGCCPNGHGELERRTECGWCDQCGIGWSVRGEEVTAHFAIEGGMTQTPNGPVPIPQSNARLTFGTRFS